MSNILATDFIFRQPHKKRIEGDIFEESIKYENGTMWDFVVKNGIM